MALSELKLWKLLGSEGDTLGSVLNQPGTAPSEKMHQTPLILMDYSGRYSIFSQKSFEDWVPIATTATSLTHPDADFLPCLTVLFSYSNFLGFPQTNHQHSADIISLSQTLLWGLSKQLLFQSSVEKLSNPLKGYISRYA